MGSHYHFITISRRFRQNSCFILLFTIIGALLSNIFASIDLS